MGRGSNNAPSRAQAEQRSHKCQRGPLAPRSSSPPASATHTGSHTKVSSGLSLYCRYLIPPTPEAPHYVSA